jgi:hypothetical protein
MVDYVLISNSQDIKEIKASSKQINTMLTCTEHRALLITRPNTPRLTIVVAQRQDVCNWLVLTDPSPLHNRARRLYVPGTGSWMLRTPEWTDWLAGINGYVWIHGIPGAGKTSLFRQRLQAFV